MILINLRQAFESAVMADDDAARREIAAAYAQHVESEAYADDLMTLADAVQN